MTFFDLIGIIMFACSLTCCGIALRLCSRLDKDDSLGDNEKQLVNLSKNAGMYWLAGLILLSISAVIASLN